MRPRLQRTDWLRDRRRQWLARQDEVNRSARTSHRDFDRARYNVTDLGRNAQLVIPLHQFAHHAGLVEHFLRPVNRARARTEASFFGDRRAARSQDERYAVARKVREIVDGVGGADIDMHHDGLRAAIHQVGAMRHGDREVLVRHQNGLWHLGVRFLGAAEGFHDGGKVRAGIGEEIVNAVVGKRAQKGFGGDRWPLSRRCRRHGVSSPGYPLNVF